MPQRNCECREARDIVMIEVLGVYDGALYWECRSCNARGHRFEAGDWRHEKARKYVENPVPAGFP